MKRHRPTKRPVKKEKKFLGIKRSEITLFRSPVDPDARFYVASELADEHAIQEEVLGQMMKECVYGFQGKDGKSVFGLSITGVREATRIINRNPKSGMKIIVRDDRCFVEEKEFNNQKGVLARVYAVDLVSGNGNWGVKFQPYKAAARGGRIYEDTFVIEKATSKAQRNALNGLIPVELKVKMVDRFKKMGSIKMVDAPKEMVKPAIMQKTPPQNLIKIIEGKISQSNDGEELLDLAEKIDASKNLDEKARTELAHTARSKGNTLLDMKLHEQGI